LCGLGLLSTRTTQSLVSILGMFQHNINMCLFFILIIIYEMNLKKHRNIVERGTRRDIRPKIISCIFLSSWIKGSKAGLLWGLLWKELCLWPYNVFLFYAWMSLCVTMDLFAPFGYSFINNWIPFLLMKYSLVSEWLLEIWL